MSIKSKFFKQLNWIQLLLALTIAILLSVWYLNILSNVGELSKLDNLLIGILPNLIASLVIVAVIIVFLRSMGISPHDELKKDLKSFVFKQVLPIYKSGIRGYHKTFPIKSYCSIIQNKPQQIQILQTWVGDNERLIESLKIAATQSSNCKIRLLLMKPESPLTKMRSKSLGDIDSLSTTKAKIELMSLDKKISESSCFEQRIEIRVFDELPSISIFAADDIMFIGWFFKGKDDHTASWLKLEDKNTELFREVNEHFELVWYDATSLKEYLTTGNDISA